MRILHTSDWHLGKIFHERSLIEDQRFVLRQILESLKNAENEGNPFSALVVSGDIYDRAVPPPEASTLLSDFLTSAAEKFPYLHIFMISGNHDSPARLSFASSFLEKHKIHLATDTKNFLNPVVLENVKKNNEKAAFYQLPFLYPGSIKKENSDEICRSQEELFREAASQIINHHKKNFADVPAVLNAHLFTLGSLSGASERSNIGTAEQVDSSFFGDFAYGAFGHIHKFQICDKAHKCYYPGALLPYNFDDSPESCALDVEVSGSAAPKVKRIFFKPLHKITKLEGKFSDFISSEKNGKFDENKDDYLEIILTDEVQPYEPFARLKQIFPNLLLLSLESRAVSATNASIEKRKEAVKSNDFGQIFSQFLSDVHGGEAENSDLVQAEKKLFEEEARKMRDGESML